MALGTPPAKPKADKIDPAQFSPVALNILKQPGFPTSSDPCGKIFFGRKAGSVPDPVYQALFSLIVRAVPAPIGLGPASRGAA